MKKTFFFISLVCFALFSCTSGDNGDSSSNTTDVVLIKKTVSSNGEQTNFSYNGTKLIKITPPGGGDYFKFTYSGDYITKIELFYNNVSEERNEFTYSSNKLTQRKYYRPSDGIENLYNYNYNTDGSITVSRSEFNGTNWVDQGVISKIYFDVSGNKIKEENLTNNIVNYTTYFTYDTKNSPYKNITGIKYLNILQGVELVPINNLMKETHTYPGSSQIITDAVNTYQYNNKDYPISVTTSSEGETTTATIYY